MIGRIVGDLAGGQKRKGDKLMKSDIISLIVFILGDFLVLGLAIIIIEPIVIMYPGSENFAALFVAGCFIIFCHGFATECIKGLGDDN